MSFSSNNSICRFTCPKIAVLFFLLTHAIIGAFGGLFLALPEEVVFSKVFFEREGFFGLM